jgi:hypothetical protein
MSANVRKIYITHCSAKKDEALKASKAKVTPDKLYTATPTQRFVKECKNKGVSWTIFSDKYGVWFSNSLHEWYEKDPNVEVTKLVIETMIQAFSAFLRIVL